MQADLASQLLGALLDWDDETQEKTVEELMAMAEWKWDAYEGFRAGERFLESLSRWLAEFDSLEARLRWMDFILNRLVFISAREIDHLISTVYPDFIRVMTTRRVATQLGLPRHQVSRITEAPEFYAEQRRTLILGLSDGARMDQLRRSADGLSHEQIVLTTDIAHEKRSDLLKNLDDALTSRGIDCDRSFNHVLLVDDFYGSGTSLVDYKRDDDGKIVRDADQIPLIKGKVAKFLNQQDHSSSPNGDRSEADRPLLAPDFRITILLYIATRQAIDHIHSVIGEAKLSERCSLKVVQILSDDLRVKDPELLQDCLSFWDPVLEDEHKSAAAHGYKSCALPLILHHNAPNNSVSPLWADSTGRSKDGKTGQNRHALFPRYERHHSDRP